MDNIQKHNNCTTSKAINSIRNNLKYKTLVSGPFSNSGIYQLSCQQCHKKLVGPLKSGRMNVSKT
jgi:hypothetical protein